MKFLVFLLVLGGASFAMTSLMMDQVVSSVPKIKQLAQGTADGTAAYSDEEGLGQDLSDGGDAPAADARQAALQKLVEGLGKKRGFGKAGGKDYGLKLLSGKKGFMGQAGKFFKKNKNTVLPLIWWGVPLALMVLTLLSIVFFCYAVARVLCTFTLKFCNLTLVLLSLAILAAAIAGKPEFIAAIPRDMWFAPILFILGSIAVIKLIDMNYPIWNEALKAFGLPILSSVVVMVWTYCRARPG